MQPQGVERINVLGPSGAGKTHLAELLSRKTGLPLVHLDREHWLERLVKPEPAKWRAIHARLVAEERWIMDGNYFDVVADRMPRVQLVILLDPPRWLHVARMTWRSIRYFGRPRPDLGTRDEISLRRWRHVANYMDIHRGSFVEIVAWCAEHGVPLLHFTTARQARRFENNLNRWTGSPIAAADLARCAIL